MIRMRIQSRTAMKAIMLMTGHGCCRGAPSVSQRRYDDAPGNKFIHVDGSVHGEVVEILEDVSLVLEEIWLTREHGA